MPPKNKKDLVDRIIEAMREARDEVADPWDERGTLRAQAVASQIETAELVRSIAQSLSEICVRSKHRGSVKAQENSPALPCMRCRAKVKHYREIAEIIAPS